MSLVSLMREIQNIDEEQKKRDMMRKSKIKESKSTRSFAERDGRKGGEREGGERERSCVLPVHKGCAHYVLQTQTLEN